MQSNNEWRMRIVILKMMNILNITKWRSKYWRRWETSDADDDVEKKKKGEENDNESSDSVGGPTVCI